MAGPEYTSCVAPEDYEDPNFTVEQITAAAAVVAAFFTGGAALVALGPAAFSALRKVLEYMLNGKLVCLDGERCAIGWVAELEPVGYQKPFPDNVDNDFSINLVLAPASLHSFVRDASDADKARKENLAIAQGTPIQGVLITERSGMPEPREAEAAYGRYHGYYSWFEGPDFGERVIVGDEQVHIPFQKAPTGPFPVPVLHAECEGSRIHDLLAVLDNIPPGLGAACKVPLIGPLLCALVSTLLAPLVIAALIAAWAAAEGGDPADAGAGTVGVGELLVVNGRWTYDAGHSGWNETHAVKTIQKVPDPVVDWSTFDDFQQRWCRLTSEAPPKPEQPGAKPVGMTPGQETAWERQQRPENDWELHPDVDGCEPAEGEPQPPPVPR
jgi:hypothetical protein